MGFLTYMGEHYNYYAKPEGQDLMGKVLGLSTWGFTAGTAIGLFDAGMKSHVLATHKPINIPKVLNCFGYWMVPMTSMCVAYSTVTYIATKTRGKYDHLNAIAGCFAAGGILHAWQRTAWISGYGTFFMILMAIIKRDLKDGDWQHNMFVPESHQVCWNFPWRNVPYRDYNVGTERWKFDKEDYYTNF